MTTQTIKTVLGTGNFGDNPIMKTIEGQPIEYINLFKKHGHKDLDTARGYGTSEHVLGQLNLDEQGLIVDSKVSPVGSGFLAPEKVNESIKTSLQELKVKQLHILYLHAPDRTTPIADTLKAVNEAYREGAFQKLGLSNYSAEDVEEIIKISKENNYVLPSVFQGNYNAITRNNEDKLFPLLRRENISFYAYSPTAGGFFLQKTDVKPASGSRWDTNTYVGKLYTDLYGKPSYYNAVERVTTISAKFKLEPIEAALRWVYFHSVLKPEYGDAVILGASKLSQLESNLEYIKKGPLPDEVVAVFESIWKAIKPDAPAYHL